MAMRAWRTWGISVGLLTTFAASAKPPVPGVPPGVDGQATPPITRDFYQFEPIAPPRLLPDSVRDPVPSRYTPPTASLAEVLAGLDVASPIRLVSYAETNPKAVHRARAALEMAELHFHACEADEAGRWYREVIRQAPTSSLALVAVERLARAQPAGLQTAEPPLADPDMPRTSFRKP